MLALGELIFVLVIMGGLGLGAVLLIQLIQRGMQNSNMVGGANETLRLEEQVASLQAEIDRLRERQDFVENLRTPPKPND